MKKKEFVQKLLIYFNKFLESNKTKRNVISIKMNKFVAKHMKLEDIKDDAINDNDLKDSIEMVYFLDDYSEYGHNISDKKIIIIKKKLNLLLNKMKKLKYKCPCCGNKTLDEKPTGTYDICDICWWEDDPVQFRDHNFSGGANVVSLNQARKNFKKYGISNLKHKKNK